VAGSDRPGAKRRTAAAALVDDLQFRTPPMQAREAGAPVSASFLLLAFRAVPTGGGS
jgi:hypothetical protein